MLLTGEQWTGNCGFAEIGRVQLTGKPLHSAVAVSATTQKESELVLTSVLDFSDSGQACTVYSTRLLQHHTAMKCLHLKGNSVNFPP